MKTNAAIREEMSSRTYIVQYNPNCSSPYLVRLCGPGKGVIDHKYYDKTKDVLGFGKTFELAARRALNAHRKQMKIFHSARRKRKRPAT